MDACRTTSPRSPVDRLPVPRGALLLAVLFLAVPFLVVPLVVPAGPGPSPAVAGTRAWAWPLSPRPAVVGEWAPPALARGDRVRRGQVLGVLRGRDHCAAGTCLHWGVRRDGEYVNPLQFVGALGPSVLLPVPADLHPAAQPPSSP